MPMLIAQVAVEVSSYTFDKPYSYRIPEHLIELAQVGVRVMVPFGRGNRKKQGVILTIGTDSPLEKIKPILAVLDKAPLLNDEMIKMVWWLKDNTFCTLFDAARALLPVGISMRINVGYTIKKGITTENIDTLSGDSQRICQYLFKCDRPVEKEKIIETLSLNENSSLIKKLEKDGFIECIEDAVRKTGDATIKIAQLAVDEENLEKLKLTPKQKEVTKILATAGSAAVKELCYFAGVGISVVNTLAKKGIITLYENEVYRNPYEDVKQDVCIKDISLTEEQSIAYNELLNKYTDDSAAVALLYGVTGSGKTSVFLKLIDKAVEDGKGVIMMVPEIALTPQTLSKFHSRYGSKVAVFHSGLSIGQRLDEWKRVKNGEALIAVGTRSAVFAPFENLGLIIMDEEQEHTYKSESSPRFHARNVSKFRCAYHKSLLVLASATPSIESYYNAKSGRYTLCTIKNRYGSAVLPEVNVVDMKSELIAGNTSVISDSLRKNLYENLETGKQSILLINRRGYNTFVGCRDCGHILTCPNCSVSMTYHQANNKLMCHYCGEIQDYTKTCPECGQENIKYSGLGTQKAQQELSELFPEAKILRMDADTTMARHSYEKKLSDFAAGKYNIMLGTQMVAKGLDFHNVTLVGILSADQSLYSDDFRSYERAFSLLTQVVGRSGRGESSGRAVIQTYSPEHSIIELSAKQDYDSFYESEIVIRKVMLYPPYADLCEVLFSGTDELKTRNAAFWFLEEMKRIYSDKGCSVPIRTLGPSSPAKLKLNNKYRYKLIIKSKNTAKFRELISLTLSSTGKENQFKDITVVADMNPE